MNLCEVCRKQAFKRCTGCRTVYYCSIVCQKVDWKHHKLSCRIDNEKSKKSALSDGQETKQIILVPSNESTKNSTNPKGKQNLQAEQKPSLTALKEDVNCKLNVITGKGMGVIASRDIEEGELVLKEDPVLKYKFSGCAKTAYELLEVYRCKFQKLPSQTQGDIMSLSSNPHRREEAIKGLNMLFPPDISQNEEFIKFVSICNSNSFNIERLQALRNGQILKSNPQKEDDYRGLYLLAARLNHSCLPNLQYYIKGNTIKFKAIYDISKGDELTLCDFIPSSLAMPPTTQVMRAHIASTMGFNCICELCCTKDTNMRQEIEDKRIKSWRLHKEYTQKFNEYCNQGTIAGKDLGLARDVLRLGKEKISELEEGECGECYQHLNTCEATCCFNFINVCEAKNVADCCIIIARRCDDYEMESYFEAKQLEAWLYMD